MGYNRILGKMMASSVNSSMKHLEEITYKTDNWIGLKSKEERDKIKRKNEIIRERTKAKRKNKWQDHINKIILAEEEDDF